MTTMTTMTTIETRQSDEAYASSLVRGVWHGIDLLYTYNHIITFFFAAA